MAEAQRDQNHIPIGMGVSNADGTTPLPLLVDAITGRLLITISIVADNVGTIPTAPASRDQNHTPVKMGYDGTNPQPLLIDSRNNLIYCDILVEP